MAIEACRVCGLSFYEDLLLRYENMPKAAQYFPDLESAEDDAGEDLEVVQCSGCGLVQLNNHPVSYYREVIRAAAFSQEMKQFRLNQFRDFVDRYHLEDKKIIEIGCGKGEYLDLMHQAGGDVYGIEFADKFVNQCQESGFTVSKDFIDDRVHRLANGPFDAFYILNFLEHLPDPNTLLRGIYNNLKDNTVGLVEVPNFDMILQKNLFSEFISDHLLYFTQDTLNTTLTMNGFEPIESSTVWHDYIISTIVRKKQRLDISRFYEFRVQIKHQIQEYISGFHEKKVAIWGAGHQSLAILSLADLANKIKYVVDSATFKQNKLTPATHIPIVSPEALESDPVQAIIVMAASYSDEVVRIIQKRFGRDIHVAVLRDFGLEII